MHSKSIIFDLGGVYFTDGTRIAIAAIAAQYNLPAEQVSYSLTGELGRQYRMGRVTAAEFWHQAKAYWQIDARCDELANIWLSSYEPIAGTNELVDRLRALGHELLFLSDNTRERVEYLDRRYGFLAKFKDGVFSHVAGRVKPDPVLFRLILEKASHKPGDCVYVDDKPALLEPARALGMTVIAFENPAELETRLQTLRIIPDQPQC